MSTARSCTAESIGTGSAHIGSMNRGIKEGSSLSPLMLNLYLDKFLDKKWRTLKPDSPLIRYADDLLILCRTTSEVREADALLRELLRPYGLELKHETDIAITDLGSDCSRWLGYDFRWQSERLAIQIPAEKFDRLARQMMLAHTKTEPAERASRVIDQWVRDLGPCYHDEDRTAILERVRGIAEDYGFEELTESQRLLEYWEDAHNTWRRELGRVHDMEVVHSVSPPGSMTTV